jgi:hypothetical protein
MENKVERKVRNARLEMPLSKIENTGEERLSEQSECRTFIPLCLTANHFVL